MSSVPGVTRQAVEAAGYGIGETLKRLRQRAGMTQEDVAKKIGCAQSRISRMESAQDRYQNVGELQRFAMAVRAQVSVILEPK